MELLVEQPLSNLLSRRLKVFRQEKITSVVHQLIATICYLHSIVIIHQDTKSEKLLKNEFGILKFVILVLG
jgi:serine/threonine protein kinase